jgi:hypothetical protein
MTQKEKRATEAFKFLVLLPFDASAKRLRDAINTTIRQARAEPIFLDQIGRGAVWVDEVSQLIRSSGAVIADVTRLITTMLRISPSHRAFADGGESRQA